MYFGCTLQHLYTKDDATQLLQSLLTVRSIYQYLLASRVCFIVWNKNLLKYMNLEQGRQPSGQRGRIAFQCIGGGQDCHTDRPIVNFCFQKWTLECQKSCIMTPFS